jgi:hypothetical protein
MPYRSAMTGAGPKPFVLIPSRVSQAVWLLQLVLSFPLTSTSATLTSIRACQYKVGQLSKGKNVRDLDRTLVEGR